MCQEVVHFIKIHGCWSRMARIQSGQDFGAPLLSAMWLSTNWVSSQGLTCFSIDIKLKFWCCTFLWFGEGQKSSATQSSWRWFSSTGSEGNSLHKTTIWHFKAQMTWCYTGLKSATRYFRGTHNNSSSCGSNNNNIIINNNTNDADYRHNDLQEGMVHNYMWSSLLERRRRRNVYITCNSHIYL